MGEGMPIIHKTKAFCHSAWKTEITRSVTCFVVYRFHCVGHTIRGALIYINYHKCMCVYQGYEAAFSQYLVKS